MRNQVSVLISALALFFSLGCGKSAHDGDGPRPLKVAAAASLSHAFKEVGEAFTAKTGRAVVLSPGASGKLAKQIIEGAPFDVLASADESWVDEVINENAAVAQSKTIYAYGRLVIWTAEQKIASIAALAEPRFKKIALAKPEHAPYGRAARQALEAAKLWHQVKPRVVYGANVRQAQQYAQTGNTEVAFTALSLVINEPKGTYLVIDDDQHSPLSQVVIATERGDQAAATQFIEFLNSPEGHAILRRYGLMQKGEPVARSGRP